MPLAEKRILIKVMICKPPALASLKLCFDRFSFDNTYALVTSNERCIYAWPASISRCARSVPLCNQDIRLGRFDHEDTFTSKNGQANTQAKGRSKPAPQKTRHTPSHTTPGMRQVQLGLQAAGVVADVMLRRHRPISNIAFQQTMPTE